MTEIPFVNAKPAKGNNVLFIYCLLSFLYYKSVTYAKEFHPLSRDKLHCRNWLLIIVLSREIRAWALSR